MLLNGTRSVCLIETSLTSAQLARKFGGEWSLHEIVDGIHVYASVLATEREVTAAVHSLLHGELNLRNSRRKFFDMNFNSGLTDTQKEREMNKEYNQGLALGDVMTARSTGNAQRVESAQEQEIREKIKAADREFTLKQVGAAIAVLRPNIVATLGALQGQISGAMVAQGFWQCNNTGEKIALMHSELSEALEGDRKKKRDEHLPGFDSVTVELADTVIRILDFAGYHGLCLGEAIVQKMQYNLGRAFMHGKRY